MKLTIDQYSKKYKMSKEMISSKIRSKKLECIEENGIKYILIPDIQQQPTTQEPIKKVTSVQQKQKTTVATVLALYQRENQQLKEKIVQLEEKIDKLIDDKEQMLRDERDKIESLYTSKDEQLKNILELINTKLMIEKEPHQTIHEVESIQHQEEINKTKEDKSKIIELREYLKSLDLKSYQRKIIKKRFLAVYDSDVRILQQNGKLYLDFSKYDYSDLLEY